MLAIWHSDTATVECLLKHSAAVGLEYIGDYDEFKGWTGLTMAVPFGPEEVVRIVAENEAGLKQKLRQHGAIPCQACWNPRARLTWTNRIMRDHRLFIPIYYSQTSNIPSTLVPSWKFRTPSQETPDGFGKCRVQ